MQKQRAGAHGSWQLKGEVGLRELAHRLQQTNGSQPINTPTGFSGLPCVLINCMVSRGYNICANNVWSVFWSMTWDWAKRLRSWPTF